MSKAGGKKVTLGDILDKEFVAVSPNTPIVNVILEMNKLKIGASIITDPSGKLMGIFTERDVLTKVIAQRLDIEKSPVSQVMTSNVITVKDTDSADEALHIMNDRHIRNLPVVDGNGKPLGVISVLTVLQSVMQSMVQSFMENY